MNPDHIPGLQEARAWEASVRNEAFLDVPQFLCGVEVCALTLHRQAVLVAARNPFVAGGEVTPEALAAFLWVISPGFRIGDEDGRMVFLAILNEVAALANPRAARHEIGEYLDRMFLDAPAGGGRDSAGVPVTCGEANYCDIFASEYGWNIDRTMHTPLPKLFALVRRIALRHDPKATFINRRSDKARGDWLRSLEATK